MFGTEVDATAVTDGPVVTAPVDTIPRRAGGREEGVVEGTGS